jgi:DNA-binding MarR family transcriptional regulator
MNIETLTKTNITLPSARKVLLNILINQGIILESLNDILKPFDLSPEQFNVLRILRGQNKKTTNMCVIQERMITKSSNTTRLIDKLLLKGLVTRNVCRENRRKIEVTITKKGLDVLEQLDPKLVENENYFASNLSETELEQLNLLLEKYRKK